MAGDNKIQVKVVNLHGATMMSVDKVAIKSGDLAMTGNIMGTMPGTFYFKPVELWKMFKMVDRSVVLAMPKLLRQGRREWKKAQRKAAD
jgi:hypothetical protein